MLIEFLKWLILGSAFVFSIFWYLLLRFRDKNEQRRDRWDDDWDKRGRQ